MNKNKEAKFYQLHFEEWYAYGGCKRILMFDLDNPKEIKEMARLIYEAGYYERIDQE